MKKAVVVVALMFALLAGLFVTLPVMADPTNGQKVSVTIKWARDGSPSFTDYIYSDGLQHRTLERNWKVELFIDGSLTPITGTAHSEGHVLWAYTKLHMAVYNEYYVISFASGGFEGEAHIMAYDYVSSTNYNVKVHGLFTGTGSFEGQTLNAGQDGSGATALWEGFLLKPQS